MIHGLQLCVFDDGRFLKECSALVVTICGLYAAKSFSLNAIGSAIRELCTPKFGVRTSSEEALQSRELLLQDLMLDSKCFVRLKPPVPLQTPKIGFRLEREGDRKTAFPEHT